MDKTNKPALRIYRDKLRRELDAVERVLDAPIPGHSIFCSCVDCGGCKQAGCNNYANHDSGYCESHRCPYCSYVGKLVPAGLYDITWCCHRCAKQIEKNDKDMWR